MEVRKMKESTRTLLKKLQDSKGTIRNSANSLGITERHLINVLRGDSNPSTELAFRFGIYFDESVYNLFPDLFTKAEGKISHNNNSRLADIC